VGEKFGDWPGCHGGWRWGLRRLPCHVYGRCWRSGGVWGYRTERERRWRRGVVLSGRMAGNRLTVSRRRSAARMEVRERTGGLGAWCLPDEQMPKGGGESLTRLRSGFHKALQLPSRQGRRKAGGGGTGRGLSMFPASCRVLGWWMTGFVCEIRVWPLAGFSCSWAATPPAGRTGAFEGDGRPRCIKTCAGSAHRSKGRRFSIAVNPGGRQGHGRCVAEAG